MTKIELALRKEFTIIGVLYQHSNCFKFITYSEKELQKGEVVKLAEKNYKCTFNIDVTTDEEKEEGLSYVEIEIEKV